MTPAEIIARDEMQTPRTDMAIISLTNPLGSDAET